MMCRFYNCPYQAAYRVKLSNGCACYPADHLQYLCPQHAKESEPLGEFHSEPLYPRERGRLGIIDPTASSADPLFAAAVPRKIPLVDPPIYELENHKHGWILVEDPPPGSWNYVCYCGQGRFSEPDAFFRKTLDEDAPPDALLPSMVTEIREDMNRPYVIEREPVDPVKKKWFLRLYKKLTTPPSGPRPGEPDE